MAFKSAALGTGWVILGLSLKCNMFSMCFFTASTISGCELGTSFESVARAHDGQSVTELCPSDPGVGELLTIIQQSTNKNPLFQSKGILAAKVVVIPFLKGPAFPPPSRTVFLGLVWFVCLFVCFSFSSANSLEQEPKVFCEVLFAGSLSECNKCCRCLWLSGRRVLTLSQSRRETHREREREREDGLA